MASFNETLAYAMEAYPSLFPNEEVFLHHAFFVNGNGYEWKEGELVSFEGMSAAKLSAIKARHKIQDERSAKALRMTVLELKHAVTKIHAKGKPYQPSIYPLWERSHIVCLPDDIKPDWFAAAQRAMIFAETLKKTDTDRKWLSKASIRIQELANRLKKG